MANPDSSPTADDNEVPEQPAPADSGEERFDETETETETETVPPAAAVPLAAVPKVGPGPFRVLIGIAIAMVLAIGAALFIALGDDDLSAAEGRVLSYYKALSNKDGKAAKKLLKHVEGEVYDVERDYASELADSPFWTSAALSSGYRAPEDVEVVHSAAGTPPGVDGKPKRRYAIVTVSYTVDGRPATESFSLEDRKGEWEIVTARLSMLTFGESPFQYWIAGFTPATDEDYGNPLLPPGTYEISLADHDIFEDEQTELAVAPGLDGAYGTGPWIRALDLKVRDGIVEDVESQVKELLDFCATADTFESVQYDCDWYAEDGEPIESLEDWDIKSYPELDITVDKFGDAEVKTVKPGKAVGEDMYGRGEVTAVIAPEGSVVAEEGEVVWTGEF